MSGQTNSGFTDEEEIQLSVKNSEPSQIKHTANNVPNLANSTSTKDIDLQQTAPDVRLVDNELDDSRHRENGSTSKVARGTERTSVAGQYRSASPSESSRTGTTAEELLERARGIITLFPPVSACMICVVIIVTSIRYYRQNNGEILIYTPFNDELAADTGTRVWQTLTNALIFLSIVIVATVLLVLLYKYRCYKVLYGWLIVSSLLILFIFFYIFLGEFCREFNIPIDYISTALFMWNFGFVGMVSIFWKGPLVLQQVFLIITSALMALIFISYLSEWTLWTILAVISIWDLVAVLCPFGPLKILVNLVQQRNESFLPSLIYSTTAAWNVSMAEGDFTHEPAHNESQSTNREHSSSSADDTTDRTVRRSNQTNSVNPSANHFNSTPGIHSDTARTRETRIDEASESSSDDNDEPKSGVKLGLGDFVFYSILVGKAATYSDWITTLACFVAILIGLASTLMLLGILRKPLPALPISIFFGLVFYFVTSQVISPFINSANNNQIFL